MARKKKPRPAPPIACGGARTGTEAATTRARAALVLAFLVSPGSAAFAFPLLDSSVDSSVTGSRDLTSGESSDLQHQLQLVNGFSAPAGGGWTFVPHIDLQEELTDNVYQAHTPRRWDLVTFISPGFNLAGDLPRLTLTMSYNPSLALYARNSSLNGLSQQLNALGELTVVPDLAFVDIRALSGVSSLYGGLGGQGSVGAQAGALASTTSAYANSQGLNRQNETQTSSFGMTPYLRQQFGDLGVGRIGYAIDVTRSNQLSGFASLPIPSGGQNGQTLVTNEEFATFTSGDVLDQFQDVISVDLTQGQTATQAGFINGFTGLSQVQSTTTRSEHDTYSNQITYQMNRDLSVFVKGGYEHIDYSGALAQRVNDLIWRFGATLTPGPDTTITISYGHENGFNSLAADGHYALTARVNLTLSYNSTLGTQLQYIQQQLNAAAATTNGQFVNGTTGGPLFFNTNALAQQDSLYRTDSLVFGANATWDRDILSLTVGITKQTVSGAGSNGSSTDGRTVAANWTHSMRPDMTVSAGVSLNQQTSPSGNNGNVGNSISYAATLGWQYQLTETVGINVRYSFFDRISQVSTNNVYQSLLFAGLSKSF
jgi:hypothetical protein